MRFLKKTVISSLVVLAFPSFSWAETIQLKSGQIVEGKVIGQDNNSIKVDVGTKEPMTYSLDEVRDIFQDISKTSLITKYQADQLEAQAVERIDNNKMDEGLALMKRAVELDPIPMRHMNYGSILFGNGVDEFENSHLAQSRKILHQAEAQFNEAIAGFDPNKEKIFISQAYFLLGEIYLNALLDTEKAKAYYKKSLTYYDNPGAKANLQALQ